MKNNLDNAISEIRAKSIVYDKYYNEIIDFNYGNIIIIDYSPENKKFKLGFIDLLTPNSKSF